MDLEALKEKVENLTLATEERTLNFGGNRYTFTVEMFPDWLVVPLENGGTVPVEYLKFKTFPNIRRYFLNHSNLPMCLFDKLLISVGFGSINASGIEKDKIDYIDEVSDYLTEVLSGMTAGAFFLGPPGTGKTTTLAYMVLELWSKSKGSFQPSTVRYVEMNELLGLLTDRMKRDDVEKLKKCKLLIIDEFMQPKKSFSDRVISEFQSFFSYRYQEFKLITWLATNKNWEQLKNDQNLSAITSRLRDERRFGLFLNMIGNDLRLTADSFNADTLGCYEGFMTKDNLSRWSIINYMDAYNATHKPNRKRRRRKQ